MEVGIRELRDGLSRHLAEVRAGHTIHVTDHGRVIAKIVPVGVPTTLERLAADVADRAALGGYDALHCASAEQIDEPDVVAATGDHALLAARRALGVATFDPNRQD